MIEIQKARNEEPIICHNNKILCSKVKPSDEAEKWVDSVSKEIEFSDAVFVLGLGSAYHIKSLKNKYPNKRVVVIEREAEVVDLCKKYFSDVLINVDVILIKEVEDLFKNDLIRSSLLFNYSVLMFVPAQSTNRDFYIKIQEQLIARDDRSLERLLEIRKSWALAINLNTMSLVNEGPLTINDIMNKLSEEPSRKKILLKVLGELVV